jgi:hypothetical protein
MGRRGIPRPRVRPDGACPAFVRAAGGPADEGRDAGVDGDVERAGEPRKRSRCRNRPRWSSGRSVPRKMASQRRARKPSATIRAARPCHSPDGVVTQMGAGRGVGAGWRSASTLSTTSVMAVAACSSATLQSSRWARMPTSTWAGASIRSMTSATGVRASAAPVATPTAAPRSCLDNART